MKALLKLAPITEPKEEMKVIWMRRSVIYTILEIFQEKDGKYCTVQESDAGVYKISTELSQIVGEYQTGSNKETLGFEVVDTRKTIVLPVSVEDWQYILDNNLIGKEVEIDTLDAYGILALVYPPKQEKILYTAADMQKAWQQGFVANPNKYTEEEVWNLFYKGIKHSRNYIHQGINPIYMRKEARKFFDRNKKK